MAEELQSLSGRGRELLRKHEESISLRAGLELCRRATGQEDTVPADIYVRDLRRGFDQCSSMRVQDTEHVNDMVAAAMFCLKADVAHDDGAQAAKAVLSAIDPACSGASQPAAKAAQLSLDVAISGNALAVAQARPAEVTQQGTSFVAQFHAIKKSLSAFKAACSALGEEEAKTLKGSDSWRAATLWADAELESLAAAAKEQHLLKVQAAVSNMNPGGKSVTLGGSWKAGLTDDATWQDVVREMESCFWSKPQALAELEEGTSALKTALEAYTGVCGEVQHAVDEKLTKTANEALQEAYSTLTEEYFVCKCITLTHQRRRRSPSGCWTSRTSSTIQMCTPSFAKRSLATRSEHGGVAAVPHSQRQRWALGPSSSLGA